MTSRLKKKLHNPLGHHHGGEHDHSDSVSELSNDDESVRSNFSKTSNKFSKMRGKFTNKLTGKHSDGTASVGSASRASKRSTGRSRTNAASGARKPSGTRPRPAGAPGATTSRARASKAPPSSVGAGTSAASPGGPSSVGSSSRAARKGAGGAQSDAKRLQKDAKSRFNIGLVYLKTGDYAKAQDNLEHSLYCHTHLHGHDAKIYDNATLCAIAGVREKLGDCYLGNDAQVEKSLALDHFEEARRLLKSVHAEDAGENVKEMLERVEEKLNDPQLNTSEVRRNASRAPPKQLTSKYQMHPTDKARKTLGVGAASGAVAGVAAGGVRSRNNVLGGNGSGRAKRRSASPADRRDKRASNLERIDILGVGNTVVGKGFKQVLGAIDDGFHAIIDDSSEEGRSSFSGSLHPKDADDFAVAMTHLERDNHRTALNYLTSLQEDGNMKNDDYRTNMAMSMMKVADSAMDAGKTSVATDAYEVAYAIYKQDNDEGLMKLAMRGCIKGNKLLAREAESLRSYGPAIQHRSRAYQLLDEDKRCVPASQQLIRIAYLHGEKDDYAKSAVTLNDARRRIFRGIKSLDMMPQDRLVLLVQIYSMLAICYAKQQKWSEALEQYDELMPLVAKMEGQGGKAYNSAVIHKAALLVTMGNHRLAASTVDKYLKISELNDHQRAGELIVDDKDHLLALDTSAATNLKMGNIDKAITLFEKKLKFVKSLPGGNGDEMKKIKSDTMHRLGCLLAYQKQHKTALPLLNEALSTRKSIYDGRHKSVFETTWAVAATNHTLGDNDKALKDYAILLEKMGKVEDLPVDAVVIQNSAGKLYYEDCKLDKAVHSFRQALKGSGSDDLALKGEITLNLANALSARGESDEAMELFNKILKNKSLKKTKIFFVTMTNKSQLLIRLGEVDDAKEILNKIVGTRSSLAHDVKGSIHITLGNLAVADGDIDEAIGCYEKAIEYAAEDDDAIAQAQAKKQIGIAYMVGNQDASAIETFEDVLEDLSQPESEGGSSKQAELLKAEVWNSMAKVYKKKDDMAQAKNFAKLALQTYKTQLGENNPITLRNVSNLQLLLLEEAEELEKSKAKPIIDAAKYELEGTLDAFESMNDSYTYRLDVASLTTNLGFVAVWQGKPKKARKLVRQILEIELPEDHFLVHRIEVLEERVDQLEKKKSK